MVEMRARTDSLPEEDLAENGPAPRRRDSLLSPLTL